MEGAQPPKGLDFETRRQYYAAELEKTLDGVAAEEGDDPQASSEIAVEAASGGASPSYQASQNEERRESSSNGLSTSESSEPFPSQGKVPLFFSSKLSAGVSDMERYWKRV